MLDCSPVTLRERDCRQSLKADESAGQLKQKASVSGIINTRASEIESEIFAKAEEIRRKWATLAEARADAQWGLVTPPRLDPEAAFPSSSGNSRMHLVRRKREADAYRRLTPWEASDVVKILVDKVPDNCTHAQALEVVASLTGEGCLTEELGRELATDEADFSPIANLFSSPETDVPSAELIRTIIEEFPWKFLSDERLQRMVHRLSKQAEKLMTKGDLKGAQEANIIRFCGSLYCYIDRVNN
ncbi:hypothetical protein Pmar_PMAR028630 [Perkinsus marinus ATCC 50983]|uniref:Uncharacterized protein n=1 Tax=Perkinsus marinus (strain ATCC 50983 / TXsc) TaxID=423536 RepID=C5K8F8_PERM5|nr:hypothetical protein Pmar_PMAR028630 [Perkinsus marinus ATCC 50983]EER19165.1 hypothetical protein Pmar_PMAR028630 [Perkinsus marinus ATCC 50983]|eukprot:XP_002787369.1 hypothetical protein Pmar_PMAR028630 [Perkinsus marinus ATCC 50983]